MNEKMPESNPKKTRFRSLWAIGGFALGIALAIVARYSAYAPPGSARHYLAPVIGIILIPVASVYLHIPQQIHWLGVVGVLLGMVVGMCAIDPHSAPAGLAVIGSLLAVGSAIWWIVFGIPQRIRDRRARRVERGL